MVTEVLFIQGVGEGAYEEDSLLAKSLQKELGSHFKVTYPKMPDEVNAPYDTWKTQIQKELDAASEPVILVGHSLGASYIAKLLTQVKVHKPLRGIFLLEAPFWGGQGWLYEGYEELELPQNVVTKFPDGVKLFLYHTRDDEIVPFDHLALYSTLLPQATVREIEKGGHQLNNDLSVVARDIKELK
ncbi:MAG TPA: alpha/beta hydrolase [Candidatus Saccharimonadales bacterium]|nr:alpha/beta hydrolase [Candidatus Saccharimonadales bacterium]